MIQNKNEITLENVGGIIVVNISGDVTAQSETVLLEAYQKANTEDARRLIFKFDEHAYINSGGIAVLIQILAETHKNKQHTGIIGLSSHFKKIFNMVGITKFAKIYSTLDDALKAMPKS